MPYLYHDSPMIASIILQLSAMTGIKFCAELCGISACAVAVR
jgi:hypothetical protein